MEELLRAVAHYVAMAIEAIAILIIALGSTRAVVGVFTIMLARDATRLQRREVWLDYAHWLVAGMTFQLAADIVSTSLAASWDDIGRLAVIAGIRTFLSYFLDREVESTRKLQVVDEPHHPANETS
ncbi:MAG: DUF1622 domain-containing protein [Betaproteobacteria bacterium]